MKFKFHHMNLCTEDVPRITNFYQSLFGLQPVHGYVRVDGSTSYGGNVNFVTDGFPALALATERVHADALRRPPRPADAEFADPPFLRRLALAGSLIALVSLVGFEIGWREGANVGEARALGFAVLVTSHVTWALAARSRTRTLFGLGLFSNLPLVVVCGATLTAQVLIQSHAASAALLGLPPLGAGGWLRAVTLGLLPVTLIEISKLLPRAARRAEPSQVAA